METKIHSKEDAIKCLVDRLKEELTDVDTYNSLYESFKAAEMCDIAADIERIARDEFYHAEILHDILMREHKYDVSTDQEIVKLWHRAKQVFGMI